MKRLQVLVLALALTACATPSEEAADEPMDASGNVCVSVRNINSFDAIDDEHIYVKANGQPKHLLFTMQRRCTGLRGASGIAVKDATSRVCSNGFGEVIYRDMGRGLESCRIETVEVVASKDDARGLIEDRKDAKRQEQPENQ
jgi:hypothetical protein